MSKTRVLAKRFFHIAKSQSLVKLSADPYSTHLPILIGLARIYKIETVTEYGSGLNSTLAFTNKAAFPNLIRLKSYENDLSWLEKMREMVKDTPEVELVGVDGEMATSVRASDIQSSDLVFIDDSYTSRERSNTIRAVIGFGAKLVVVHDFETPRYRMAGYSAPSRYRIKALLPNTGVLGTDVASATIKRLERFINAHSSRLRSDDVLAWAREFDRGFKQ